MFVIFVITVRKRDDSHVVAFFEKNGLQHGEFRLREPMAVEEVGWNSDSSVLLGERKIRQPVNKC